MLYQFKTKSTRRSWEETDGWTRPFSSDKDAAAYAQDCADADQKETRWNVDGSGQGNYVSPMSQALAEAAQSRRQMEHKFYHPQDAGAWKKLLK